MLFAGPEVPKRGNHFTYPVDTEHPKAVGNEKKSTNDEAKIYPCPEGSRAMFFAPSEDVLHQRAGCKIPVFLSKVFRIDAPKGFN